MRGGAGVFCGSLRRTRDELLFNRRACGVTRYMVRWRGHDDANEWLCDCRSYSSESALPPVTKGGRARTWFSVMTM